MSKSYNNTLPIFGEEKATPKLIMRIPTDSTPVEEPKPTEKLHHPPALQALRLRGRL